MFHLFDQYALLYLLSQLVGYRMRLDAGTKPGRANIWLPSRLLSDFTAIFDKGLLTSKIPSAAAPHPLSPSTLLSIRRPLVIPTTAPVVESMIGPPEDPCVGRMDVRRWGS